MLLKACSRRKVCCGEGAGSFVLETKGLISLIAGYY